jgi:hypothetical protein
MATRAERFRAETERKAQAGKKRKRPKGPKGRRHDGLAHPASHNDAAVRGKNRAYAIETSRTARPSRKSTRKSKNRQKNDSGLRITVTTAGRKRGPVAARGRR